ncbi:phage tail assembly protein [Roseomonas sp. NAR14]|uniref:Phage tail assembly protein n=1 Tax=Roseomonas acroporae TaxID=2937791 RepID=A0A9X1Y8M5_9PROT|nr:phage tail assembly protein [Roseomonas acroporae]MCK8784127.1 phage tail assembly protein [Roseomonas acroporae]
MPEELVITFPQPIEWNLKTYDHITLTTPTAGAWADAEQSTGTAGTMKLMAAVGSTPEQVVRQMRISQIFRADRFFQHCAAISAEPGTLKKAIEAGRMALQLDPPVVLDGKSYARLDLHEPNGADWDAAETERGLASTITLIARTAGVPSPAVRQIPVNLALEADVFFQGFSVSAPGGGGS